jgi:hypothetical protein
MKKLLFIFILIGFTLFIIHSCKHEPPVLIVDPTPVPGPVTNNGICFESEVLPLFQTNCAKSGCHDATSHVQNLVLDSYTNILRRNITPGNADVSKIYKVLFETGNKKMPPLPNTDLTVAQKALIGKWINEGAKNTVNCGVPCDSAQFKYTPNISLILRTYCTGCHSGVAASGNIDLSNYTNVKLQVINGNLVGAVTHTVGFSPMPQNAGKLNDCQISQIKKWVAAGALNN